MALAPGVVVSSPADDYLASSAVGAWAGVSDAVRKGSLLHGHAALREHRASLATSEDASQDASLKADERALSPFPDADALLASYKNQFKAPINRRDTDREYKVIRVERVKNNDPSWLDFQNKFYTVCVFPAGIQIYSANMDMNEDLT